MTVGSKVKQTLAAFKGVESTLRIYSVQSESKEEREIFEEARKVTEEIIKNLDQRVIRIQYEEPQYKNS